MLRPSSAPRWKTAISRRLRPSDAAAARVRNAGAKPSDSIAAAPDLMKTRRVVVIDTCLPPLKLGATDRGGLLGTGDALGDIHPRHQCAGGDPRVCRVVVAGWRLAHV